MKKIISILSLVAMLILIVIGCGEKDNDVSTNQTSSKETTTKTSSVVETVSKEETANSEEKAESSKTESSSKAESSKVESSSKTESSKVESSSKTESSKVESSSKAESSKVESSSKAENSKVESSSKTESSKPQTSSIASSTVSKPDNNKLFPGYKYNTKIDIEDNVFLDSLAYTGYNIKKHRQDGLMWTYILSSDKAHRNWLSNITYGGGCTGLETKNGLPNIGRFEQGGLVCASFATYVYFNYLPNVAKIDTSSLAVPDRPYSANSFYEACKKWLADGYTYNIGFTAKDTPAAISLKEDQEIPIGSIFVFRDYYKPQKKQADHIAIYVGSKNGYHWVIQTGNENGPEFSAVERFKFGPDKQWPLAIFATPNCVYDAINKTDA